MGTAVEWPDIVIGGLALIFALKGWKRGFVSELGGAVALCAAIIAALRYPGSLDDLAERFARAGPGAAHIVGMIVFALAVYAAFMALTRILGRFATLPVISLGNSAAGALLGLAKALAGAWAVLYIALFFPLTHDVRSDLRRSTLVSIVTQPNGHVDALMRGVLPAFMKGYVDPIFTNHRV
jgi:uncharacterized membrane protein required for colicin V production